MGGENIVVALGAVILAVLVFIFGSAFLAGFEYETIVTDQLFSWGTMYLVSGLLIVVVIFVVIYVSRR